MSERGPGSLAGRAEVVGAGAGLSAAGASPAQPEAGAAPGPAGSSNAKLVLAHVKDLLFSSRIGETARRLGLPFRAARTLDELRRGLGEGPGLVLLDLGAADLDMGAALDAVDAAGRPAPVLAWTSHALWKATRALHGRCDRVVTRETLTAELPDLLVRPLGSPR